MLDFDNILSRSAAMKVVTYSHARNALKSVLDSVVRDSDVVIISRRDAEGDAVVMSLDHYNSLMETLHLLSTPANAEAMARAIRQDRAGEAQPRALLDTDGA
jgi:antitoxin YefM